ncbi:hypothetical protein HMN09_00296700 [Mycena chlorophos]|uniref:Uncharacterized protein n=1 Tax=Mycena chlorophos TaxID=658473 RepID=A0A8H6TMV3_MYCCL|nr:hypothetical protein HMN09_00296700 [Mycena chlorophos]
MADFAGFNDSMDPEYGDLLDVSSDVELPSDGFASQAQLASAARGVHDANSILSDSNNHHTELESDTESDTGSDWAGVQRSSHVAMGNTLPNNGSQPAVIQVGDIAASGDDYSDLEGIQRGSDTSEYASQAPSATTHLVDFEPMQSISEARAVDSGLDDELASVDVLQARAWGLADHESGDALLDAIRRQRGRKLVQDLQLAQMEIQRLELHNQILKRQLEVQATKLELLEKELAITKQAAATALVALQRRYRTAATAAQGDGQAAGAAAATQDGQAAGAAAATQDGQADTAAAQLPQIFYFVQ